MQQENLKLLQQNNNFKQQLSKQQEVNDALEKKYEDGIAQEDTKEKKMANDRGIPPELRQIKKNIAI